MRELIIVATEAASGGRGLQGVTATLATHGLTLERILRGTGDGGTREFHRVMVPDAKAEALQAELQADPDIEAAYLKPPEAQAPISPDLGYRQGYLEASPAGIDARYAWTKRAKGAGVRAIVIEQNWVLTHEDLTPRSQLLAGTLGSASFRQHGTAVLGILKAEHNDPTRFGVHGVVDDARVDVISGANPGLGMAEAIRTAYELLSPGDLILVEAQRPGPRYNFALRDDQKGYLPLEWWPDEYEAVRAATEAGVVVVSCAGNGGENLDNTLYDQPPATGGSFPSWWRNPFRRGASDSGSIVVGAGAPPTGTHGRSHGTDRSRLAYSNYGSCVDAQAWGEEVTSTGYGDLHKGSSAADENLWYTDRFGGTSAAGALVASALISVSGFRKAGGKTPLTPALAREMLHNTGAPQQAGLNAPTSERIGNRVDIRALLNYVAPSAPDFSHLELHLGSDYGQIDIQHARKFPGSKGQGVKVCVVDRGFPTVPNPWHEDLPNVTLLGNTGSTYNKSNAAHGVYTLGLIAAKDNNSGYRGLVPEATLYACPISHSDGGEYSNVQVAINTLSAGDIMVFNFGVAGPNYDNDRGPSLGNYGTLPGSWRQVLRNYAAAAVQKGIIVVMSANNGSQNLDDAIYQVKPLSAVSPWTAPFNRAARDDGIIYVSTISPGTVRETTRPARGTPTDIGNYGSIIDAAFWGYDMTIISRYKDAQDGGEVGNWYYTSGMGTSMATPTVGAVLASAQGALKAAGKPLLTPATARAALRATGSAQTGADGGPSTQRVGNLIDLKALFNYFGLYAPPDPGGTSPLIRLGMLGTFVLGRGNSYLGEEEGAVMEPYPILHTRSVLAEKLPETKVAVQTTLQVERVDGFSGVLTYSVDPASVPSGFSGFKFSPLLAPAVMGSPESVLLEFAIDGTARYQGAALRVRAAKGGAQVATALVYVSVAPPAFCAINGLPIPITEPSLQPTLETLGDKARALDGTLQSSVRGFKRSWAFALQLMSHQEYAAYAQHLFTDVNAPKVMSGGITPGEALLVVLSPKEPRIVKAGSLNLYGLQGQIDER